MPRTHFLRVQTEVLAGELNLVAVFMWLYEVLLIVFYLRLETCYVRVGGDIFLHSLESGLKNSEMRRRLARHPTQAWPSIFKRPRWTQVRTPSSLSSGLGDCVGK